MRSWVFLPSLVISFEVYALITATAQSPSFSLTFTEILAPCPSLTFTKEASQCAWSREDKQYKNSLERKPEWALVRSLDFSLSALGSH